MTVKVLVVDDEKEMTVMISDYLDALGYDVDCVNSGKEALNAVRSGEPDCILLDVMMPGLDGFDVIRRIRGFSDVPVIMLTARAEEGDKLMGLELGADDYIVKPFSLKEMEARIRSVLRRSHRGEAPGGDGRDETTGIIRYRDIVIDPEKMSLKREGKTVDLTAAQFRICTTLFNSPGRVFSRMDLLRSFQDTAFEGYERTIDVHIKNIRKALEPEPSAPVYIVTVYGAGYKVPEPAAAGGADKT